MFFFRRKYVSPPYSPHRDIQYIILKKTTTKTRRLLLHKGQEPVNATGSFRSFYFLRLACFSWGSFSPVAIRVARSRAWWYFVLQFDKSATRWRLLSQKTFPFTSEFTVTNIHDADDITQTHTAPGMHLHCIPNVNKIWVRIKRRWSKFPTVNNTMHHFFPLNRTRNNPSVYVYLIFKVRPF